MLHVGCECLDGASVSLAQLSNASVQCVCPPPLSFHPSIPPPPLSSSNKRSFCLSVFAAGGLAGLGPRTPADSRRIRFIRLRSAIKKVHATTRGIQKYIKGNICKNKSNNKSI